MLYYFYIPPARGGRKGSEMSGYDYSQWRSNRAVAAEERGLRPISRWRRSELVLAIAQKIGIDPQAAKELTKGYTFDQLKKELLVCCEWHHTGAKYRKTDYYGVTVKSQDELMEALAKIPAKSSKPVKSCETYGVAEWVSFVPAYGRGGSSWRPVHHRAGMRRDGNRLWFIDNKYKGKYKMLTAKGLTFTECSQAHAESQPHECN